jgi:hypothetical protein
MKTVILIFLCLVVLISCEKKDDRNIIEGYVVGFDPCSFISNHIGYVLVSENLKDTLITYNFPEEKFSFPPTLFSNYLNSGYFPTTVRYAYRVKFEFKEATGNDLIYLLCPGYLNESEFINAIQAITVSAE